jgi:hypothetical protein
MGGECFRFLDRRGEQVPIQEIGFEWVDHWTFGERLLVHGGRTYRVRFNEESLDFPFHVTYVDRGNWEQVVCEFENTVSESVTPEFGRATVPRPSTPCRR